MARVTVAREWLVRGAGDIEAAVERAVSPLGLKSERGADGLELRGGSQLRMRLLGSLLSKDDILPRQGLLRRTAAPSDPAAELVTLRLEDAFGFGFLDPVTRRKYERVLAQTAAAIEVALTASAAEVAATGAAAAQAGPASADQDAVSPTAPIGDEDGWATVVPEDGAAPAAPPPQLARTPTQAAAEPAAASAAPSPAEELERLASLLERGLLTDEEYRAAKAKLLA